MQVGPKSTVSLEVSPNSRSLRTIVLERCYTDNVILSRVAVLPPWVLKGTNLLRMALFCFLLCNPILNRKESLNSDTKHQSLRSCRGLESRYCNPDHHQSLPFLWINPSLVFPAFPPSSPSTPTHSNGRKWHHIKFRPGEVRCCLQGKGKPLIVHRTMA